MKLVLAADPIALNLKDAILAHVKEKGHDVVDVGSTRETNVDYFDCAQTACKLLQAGQADRAILFCGTGMGMSIIANKFAGITASVVETIHSAKMCRAINDANVLALGSMLWGEWNAKLAVDAFLETELADTLPDFKDYLINAKAKIQAIDEANLRIPSHPTA
ncbi:RpiB/LacA/LacB family sugar-phosphate isomerase [Novipirellula artificiosorum]|uniref:Ribose-5-phosphate isomerase B n=1 Tax=Novipirellula artificiosorum TaxID=2528016 RepID=A0A5C6DSH3_9BACT|nr:RpiB/LacA/LacB family sugar-phosphate isomerase [Novipirellula artificiosorum]TWU39680.1 Ribose-5-phosphate isomerase B [Novipirellula artificiosorum]